MQLTESRIKKQDFSKVQFLTVKEGLCVQCMHIGPYDDEPATVETMHTYMEKQGYVLDIYLTINSIYIIRHSRTKGVIEIYDTNIIRLPRQGTNR